MSVLIPIEEERKKFEELFIQQIETLRSRGCPKTIIEAFEKQQDVVISKALEMEIFEGNIPFLPVIPRSYMEINELISMVHNKEKIGFTDIHSNNIKKYRDLVDTPKKPYFIFDIENGRSTLEKTPEEAEKIIEKEKRLILTVHEGISLCIYTNVLNNHCVWCVGSRCRRDSLVFLICLYFCEVPKLNYHYFDKSFPDLGSPSCGKRN